MSSHHDKGLPQIFRSGCIFSLVTSPSVLLLELSVLLVVTKAIEKARTWAVTGARFLEALIPAPWCFTYIYTGFPTWFSQFCSSMLSRGQLSVISSSLCNENGRELLPVLLKKGPSTNYNPLYNISISVCVLETLA